MSLPETAVVLSAGRGTRARPLSFVRAKAAFPIAGEPLGRRIVAWLARHGVHDIVINLHHRPETITRQIGDGADLGVRVRYSWERTILGSAGGPRWALPLVGPDRFLLVNGDTLTDLRIPEIVDVHSRSGALVTMALIRNPDPARYGGVTLQDGWVTGFTVPGTQAASYHFIGVQVAESTAFAEVAADRASATVGALYPALINRDSRSIRGYVCAARFLDVGTAADYLETALSLAGEERRSGDLVGARCTIDGAAKLVRTIVWDDVTIEGGCSLFECVVTDRVRIPAGLRFERCALVSAADVPGDYAAQRIGDLVVTPIGRPSSPALPAGKGMEA